MDKFKVGDLVKWNPSAGDRRELGEREDRGIVLEVGDTTVSRQARLVRYALIKWVDIGNARVIYNDSSWDKTEVVARGE
jgi:hypothetical protein